MIVCDSGTLLLQRLHVPQTIDIMLVSRQLLSLFVTSSSGLPTRVTVTVEVVHLGHVVIDG